MIKIIFSIVCTFIFLSGCAPDMVRIHERASADISLVYGYIGFTDNGADNHMTALAKIVIRNLDPEHADMVYEIQYNKKEQNCGIYRGVYYCYLPPGTYIVENIKAIGQSGAGWNHFNYKLPEELRVFTLSKPRLYWLKSFEFNNKIIPGTLTFSYDSNRARWMTEERAIERLLDITKDGTGMKTALTAKLMGFRKRPDM